MIGGTVQIKCSEEQYRNFCNSEAFTTLTDFCIEHAVNLDMKFHSVVGIEWAQVDYGSQNDSPHSRRYRVKTETARRNKRRNTRRVGVFYVGTTEHKRDGVGMAEWESDIGMMKV